MKTRREVKIQSEIHAALLKYCKANGIKLCFFVEQSILKELTSVGSEIPVSKISRHL